jgi:hypothetical protein
MTQDVFLGRAAKSIDDEGLLILSVQADGVSARFPPTFKEGRVLLCQYPNKANIRPREQDLWGSILKYQIPCQVVYKGSLFGFLLQVGGEMAYNLHMGVDLAEDESKTAVSVQVNGGPVHVSEAETVPYPDLHQAAVQEVFREEMQLAEGSLPPVPANVQATVLPTAAEVKRVLETPVDQLDFSQVKFENELLIKPEDMTFADELPNVQAESERDRAEALEILKGPAAQL